MFIQTTLLSVALSVTPGINNGSDDAFADVVVNYDQGVGATLGYTTPETALGPPERFTGERFLPGVVTPFYPAFMPNEVVSIGAGGSLTVKFDTPVTDDPHNPYGIDLLMFGNSGFMDSITQDGIVTGMIGPDGGTIEVSSDGVTWHYIESIQADGLYPTMGYSDIPAYGDQPGQIPSVMTRPVDPRLQLDDFLMRTAEEVCTLYRGSGGGTGIDLETVGLEAISYVRISVPSDVSVVPEVDAIADVHARQPGDVNDDGQVDVLDFSLLLIAWGPSSPGGIPADFNLDEVVDTADFSIMLINWGL